MLDEIDRQLLMLLQADARLPLKNLAERVGLSAPAVAERLRKLQERGVIRAFTVQVEPRALGYTLQALVRIQPLPGQLKAVEKHLQALAELAECDKVTGEDGFIARLHLRSIEHLDFLLEGIAPLAQTHSAIVKSQPVARRLPGF